MSLPSSVIKLAAIRMGDIVSTISTYPTTDSVRGYVLPHLRGKTTSDALPTFTECEFPIMCTFQKKQSVIDFKEMMKRQGEKEEQPKSTLVERQEMIEDGWVFLSLKNAKQIAQDW